MRGTMDLNELAKQTLKQAEQRQANGANIKTDTFSMLKHCATEVVEAMEAYSQRECVGITYYYDREHFAAELADIIACVLIIAGKEDIDIEKALADCMAKNEKRAQGLGDKL